MPISEGEDGSRPSQKQTANYECPKCKDELGFLVPVKTSYFVDGETKEYETHEWRQCACVEERRRKRLFKSSHITEAFQQISFDSFVLDGRPACIHDAYYSVRHWLDVFDSIRHTARNSIALLGEPDTGKTHLLIAASNVLINRGVSVLYFPWVEGSNELREAVAKKEDVQSRIDAMKTVDVLYIDDLYKGRKEPTEFQQEWLFEVVNYRYLNNLPLMVSSELFVDQLIKFDKGIARRIYEPAQTHKVDMVLGKEEVGMVLNYNIGREH